MNKNTFKARLAMLGKRNRDVIAALKEYGIDLSDSQFTKAISSTATTARGERIERCIETVLTKWESG